MTYAGTVTLLFTDLVDSTALLQRAGDEGAQRIFDAHHKLLSGAVARNGGQEVKWLGDGLMVAFPSAADAVRCAIAMQNSARRPAAGMRLSLRVGLHVGDALKNESDYFGTAVVVARRLCESAAAGQILCSSLVAGLLTGRQAFGFRDLGSIQLKGIATPLHVCEVAYEPDDALAALQQTPFVGRAAEIARLGQKLEQVRAGHGALVMLTGEPGIGKTRLLEEFTETLPRDRTTVLWGRCYEGEWAPPFGAFIEAITEYVRSAESEDLRAKLGFGGPALARLVPELRGRLTDISEPVPLRPEEERFRLVDAVSQLLLTLSLETPLVLVLDDLHWADGGTVAMLRHLAHFIGRSRIFVVGAYRDVELDRKHPFADALGALRRETPYERIALKGLDSRDVGELLEMLAEQEASEVLVRAIGAETDGNPFFIREIILHLVEEKKVFRQNGRWTSNLTIEQMGIPEGVRQVIGRRLSRLSADANRLLAAASAFNGTFRFDLAASVAELPEARALDAIDEALAGQVIRAASQPESFDFAHALFRHTLYAEMSPPRQVRLHRQIAEAMERIWSDRITEHAAEVAYHYSRSAVLPGSERGAGHAIVAADRADATYAYDEVATFLRIALDLMPNDAARRSRLLGRLALALIWTLRAEEAVKMASEAGDMIASCDGEQKAAEYLAEASSAMRHAGFLDFAAALATQGLRYVGDRRDAVWASLAVMDIAREEVQDPNYPGIPLATPRRRELYKVLEGIPPERHPSLIIAGVNLPFRSRDEILNSTFCSPVTLTFFAGEYRRALPLWREEAAKNERQGRIAAAMTCWAQAGRCQSALGDFEAARADYRRGRELGARLTVASLQVMQLVSARDELWLALGEGWEKNVAGIESALRGQGFAVSYLSAAFRAGSARAYAHLGMAREAMDLLNAVIPAVALAPGWSMNYTRIACDAASVLWLTMRTDHIEVVDQSIREKVVAPDFRYPMQDGRLSLARLCALKGHYDEAAEWFSRARTALEEQGARPLRAIADFDEALMHARRNATGAGERVRWLHNAAVLQFRALGMTGWLRRAESLGL